LPADEFARRHQTLLGLLWLTIPMLVAYTAASGSYSPGHVVGHVGALVLLAVLSRYGERRQRAIACSLGLLTAAAVGVHISGGLIEAHFSFFVIVMVLTVYEDWSVFLLAVAYVLVHHGALGMVAPDEVFMGANQAAEPWRWAAIHAAFISAAGGAGLMTWRLNETVRERMLIAQRDLEHVATTDALTGLPNRRALMTAFEACTISAEPTVVVMLDLDGFKGYNDTFGHPAGDALLARLGERLRLAVREHGTAFRLGGDEFCVVARGGSDLRAAIERTAGRALQEHGDGFSIRSSYGSVLMPDEAANGTAALRLADERMYLSKTNGRRSASVQSKDVLLRALAERHPELGHRLEWMSELAVDVARWLGCSPVEVAEVGQAAELHDIGKVAIPAAILSKPGRLDEDEWQFVRRHPLIGERILCAAPALSGAARLVRSSHERWDGNGYPDKLVGLAIPIGARIIAVCDALDAMTSSRPNQPTRSLEEALEELQRCGGTQFDAVVVDAVRATLDGRAASARMLAV